MIFYFIIEDLSKHYLQKKLHMPGKVRQNGMETVPMRATIIRTNRYMVAHSNYLIACVWHSASNTLNLMEYALKSISY